MKKIGFLLISLLVVTHVMAQVPKMEGLSASLSSNDNLIKTMISPAVVVIDQSYRVKNDSTGQIYNAKNKDNFSSIASIGWRINNAIIFSNNVLCPWEKDPAFDRYKSFFTPVRYQTVSHTLSDTASKKQWPLDARIDTLQSKLLYQYKTKVFGDNGLLVDASKGLKSGYMVWVMASDSIQLDSLSLIVEEKDMLIKNESLYSVTTPLGDKFKSMLYSHSSNKIVVGGIFVLPDYRTVGTVTFKVSAVAVNVNGTWQLSTTLPISVGDALAPVKTDKALEPVKPVESELAPVDPQDNANAKSTDKAIIHEDGTTIAPKKGKKPSKKK